MGGIGLAVNRPAASLAGPASPRRTDPWSAEADPRFRVAAALPRLRRHRRAAAPLLPRLLVVAYLPRRALLRPLRLAVRLWRGARCDLRQLPGRTARLRSAARCGRLWRHLAGGGAAAQISRPAGGGRDHGPVHGAPSRSRRRAAARA